MLNIKNNRQYIVLILFMITSQIAFSDEVQETFNLDYLRTPEAAAFKKYGEESVNEYIGTTDISVPLYTIKCKDIDIPLVLRYDASGIKVEQEASWVGLGWNLMVGGCINYICAGTKDIEIGPNIHDSIWTQYLTNNLYKYKRGETSNWMAKLPYNQSFVEPYQCKIDNGWGMKQYLDRGYGERDFYSVNILGKSFMFFVDPFTLKIYKIGQAGDEFKIEIEPNLEKTTGQGRQERIQNWKIIDSNGYIYKFREGDKLEEPYGKGITGWWYTSCWYLTEVYSPKGEKVEFSYTQVPRHYGRGTRVESLYYVDLKTLDYYHFSESDFIKDKHNIFTKKAYVNNFYLEKITTANQTVIFKTSNCKESSGKRLDKITILSGGNLFKTIDFSYDKMGFGYSNVGGNSVPADGVYNSEYRLKLDNVKEIASTDTLTTSFTYNKLELPSKRSCAQDYWGYYNGKENYVKGFGYTLIPTPQDFMSYNYSAVLSKSGYTGADRLCNEKFMQAAILNRITYPTGGYTTYEYEANRIPVNTMEKTQKYKEMKESIIEASITKFLLSNSWKYDENNRVKGIILEKERTYDLYSKFNAGGTDFANIKIMILTSGVMTTIPIAIKPSKDYSFIKKITLPAGKHTLLIECSDRASSPRSYSATCQLRWLDTDQIQQSDYYLLCGGLRIKTISNYDNNGKKLNYTTYDYNNENGCTGVLLNNIETIDSLHCKYFKDKVYSPSGTYILNYTAEADVYAITPGRTRFADFYASCNPGIVGYSQVTKCRYDHTGKAEKTIITTFKNESPKNFKDAGSQQWKYCQPENHRCKQQ